MLKTVDFYYFSPTGGTKKAGMLLATGIAKTVHEINLSEKAVDSPCSDVVVIAAPVFAGRIPALVSERLAGLDGHGRKAITAVVYGVRAYDDALLELNDVMENSGFEIIASAALVARHSIVPEVGAGRPDQVDEQEIKQFANRILRAMDDGKVASVAVPGNRPYKESPKSSFTPVSLSTCGGCGDCVAVCPTEAIEVRGEEVLTNAENCMMCMACVANCPTQARVLPPALSEGLAQKLSVFKDVRKENEFYI